MKNDLQKHGNFSECGGSREIWIGNLGYMLARDEAEWMGKRWFVERLTSGVRKSPSKP